jgi:predicted 3-demethylubiquinone-9 3-methyltransferase (glyoxalase superfamily)
MTTASTALMFVGDQCGRAQAAPTFYAAHIPGFSAQRVERIEDQNDPRTADVRRAEFTIGDARLVAFDSAAMHSFTFTPAVSIWLDVDAAHDFRLIVTALADGGVTHMPTGDYGFSQQFAWVDDRFGLSWQINLPFPPTD